MQERETCQTHEGNAVIAKCSVCGKGICRECRDEFGYFCGKECLESSRGSVDPVQKKQTAKKVEAARNIEGVIKTVLLLVALAAVAGVGFIAWKFFLSPYGKLAWSWEGSVSPEDFVCVDASPSGLVFVSQGAAVRMDAASGKAQVERDPALGRLSSLAGKVQGGAVLEGESELAMLSKEGRILWTKNFGDSKIVSAKAGENGIVAVCAQEKWKGEDNYDVIRNISCLKPADGSVVWERKLSSKESPMNVVVGKEVFAFATSHFEKEEFSYLLKVCDLKTGAEKWQVKLKSLGSWGPEFSGDDLLFINEDCLNAVSSDGKRKLWSAPLGKGALSADMVKLSGELLVLSAEDSFTCVDLKERKTLWKKRLGLAAWSFALDGGRLFVLGSLEEAESPEAKLPATMEDLKDQDLNPGALADIAKKAKRPEVCLAAFDGKTGKELWRRDKAKGEMVCGGGRLVLVNDTAKTSMLSMIGGTRKGDTCVFQINPATGKDIASGSNEIGLTAPFEICGPALIGIVYDRYSGGPVLGGRAQKEKYLGLAAFKLE